MSVSYWLDGSSQSPKRNFDVLIVGAGLSGASTAYWLKKEDPNLSVALVDKGSVASGASGRNAGFVTCGSVEHFNRLVQSHGESKAVEIWKYSETNLDLLKAEIIGGQSEGSQCDDLDFDSSGSFSLAASDSEFKELQEVARWMEKYQIPTEVLKEEAVTQRLGVKGFCGGIKYLRDGSVHPVKLIQKILDLAQCPVFEFTEVFDFASSGPSGPSQIRTNRGLFEAGIVVLAGNGYQSLLSSYFDQKILPTRGQVLVLEPVGPAMEGPCYASFYLDYFRQLPSGHLLIGGFRQEEEDSSAGYSDHITEAVQRALGKFIDQHLPQFADKKVLYRWSGLMGFSADGLPILGALPQSANTFFLGGYTGHGLGMAFHCGKSLAKLIFGEKLPDFLSARRL